MTVHKNAPPEAAKAPRGERFIETNPTATGAMEKGQALASKGYKVFPLAPRSKAPIKDTAGCRDATCDRDDIQDMFQPSDNLGLATGAREGKPSFWVLDIDPAKGGAESLAQLVEEHDELPFCPTQETGGGGYHYLFEIPKGVTIRNSTDVLDGIDVRGSGGYVVVEPSVHPDGGTYRWRHMHSVLQHEPSEAPPWLIDLVKAEEPDPVPLLHPSEHIPPDEVTIRKIGLALAWVSPICDRDPWRNIGMGLHHEFGGSDQGLEIWNAWSARAGDALNEDGKILYQGPGHVANQWKSFKPDVENPITIQFLYAMAAEVNPNFDEDLHADAGIDLSGIVGPKSKTELPARGRDQENGTESVKVNSSPKSGKPGAPILGSAIAEIDGLVNDDWLKREPGKRHYLLRHSLEDGDGFIPGGCVGILASAGGVGKSYALLQLAVSLATGRPWLDRFLVGGKTEEEPFSDRSMILLGEEDEKEAKRRLYYVCDGMGLSDEEKRLVQQKVRVLPLHSKRVPLLRMKKDKVEATEHMAALKEKLYAEEWGLVAIDPLSRFAGVDAEMDNQLATILVQHLEGLTGASGHPAVILSSHSSKASRRLGQPDVRGVTGIHDAARFVMTLKAIEKSADVELRQTKSNYSGHMEPVRLRRGQHGILSIETSEQRLMREQHEKEAKTSQIQAKNAGKKATKEEEDWLEGQSALTRVLVAVQEHDGKLTSRNSVQRKARLSRNPALAAAGEAEDDGLIRQEKGRKQPIFITERGKKRLAELMKEAPDREAEE